MKPYKFLTLICSLVLLSTALIACSDNTEKKQHLEEVYQKLLTDKVPHRQHQDLLELSAKAFDGK